jgi:hypothetical protein
MMRPYPDRELAFLVRLRMTRGVLSLSGRKVGEVTGQVVVSDTRRCFAIAAVTSTRTSERRASSEGRRKGGCTLDAAGDPVSIAHDIEKRWVFCSDHRW